MVLIYFYIVPIVENDKVSDFFNLLPAISQENI